MSNSRPESAGESVSSIDMESNPDDCDVPFQHYHASKKPLDDPNLKWVDHWGRRYIRAEDEADEPNLFPSDEREHERLLIQHYLFRTLFGGRSVFAPLNKPKRILDIGSGTGLWVNEVAARNPETEVTGLDNGPPPESEEVADNVRHITDDAVKGEWGSQPYSYIHTRMMLGCFEEYREVIGHAFKYLEPGGWFEAQELYPTVFCEDKTITADNPYIDYVKMQDEAAMTLRRPLRVANKLKKWLGDAGFIDVREEIYSLPINGWSKCPTWKMLGRFWCKVTVDSLQGWTYRPFHAAFGWNQMETETYLVNVKNALKDRSSHGYQKIYVVYGRKPPNARPQQLS